MEISFFVQVGSIAQWLAYLLPEPAALDLNLSVPEIFAEEK